MIKTATATFRDGRLELTTQVDWPDGIQVEVKPIVADSAAHQSWLTLTPLDVGEFRPPLRDDDLLAEMLDDSRN